MNGFKWIMAGGPIAWIITAMTLLAIGMFLERMFHLRRARIVFRDFIKGVFNILEKGGADEALSLCDDTPGPIARLMHTAIMHRDRGIGEISSELESVGRIEIARMERRLAMISTIAQLAPCLGLLGTLMGILQTVNTINSSVPEIVSTDITGGVVTAVTTSIFGLVSAIVCHAFYNMLVVRIDRIVQEMAEAASDIRSFFAGRGDRKDGGAKHG